MRKFNFVFLAACLLPFSLIWGQNGPSSKRIKTPLSGTVDLRQPQDDYYLQLYRLEAPRPDGNSEKARLAAIKAGLAAQRQAPSGSSNKVDSLANAPWLGANFQSNQIINGVPNDNDMAVSNTGKVVSVINSNIYVHESDGTLITNISLGGWSSSLGINGSKFDPRTLYDPIHDRFIVACLNGITDSTSYIILGFSQTNDPAGAWNLYALPGDPNNDSLWTDYPIMALSPNELFLTGNLLYNDQPWQTGFNQSICWQIDLDSAYAGNALDSRLWYNIQFGGASIRNLCPIQAGSGPVDNNMYLLSNRNFAMGNDTVFIMEITDTLAAPGVQYLVDYGITDVPYRLAPSALQQFNQYLATNDARWLDGFIENGNIQFVGNCGDSVTGRAAFYHGTIQDIRGARIVTGRVIGNPNGDYGYPAIASMAMNPGDQDALLAINYCGPTATERAGCGAIYYDGNGSYSSLVKAKAGLSYIDVLTGEDRWGDYTGVQKKYDEPGVTWMAGTYAKTNRTGGTWVAEFHHPSIVAQDPGLVADDFKSEVFPNPSIEFMTMTFALEADAFLDISILDMQGRKVKTLMRDLVRAGSQKLSFSLQPLAAGTYFVNVMNGDQILSSSKIVKQ